MNGHCGVYCQSCVLKGIFYISSSRCLFTTTLFVLICLDSTYMFGKHAIRRHFQRYPADQRRWRIQKKTHGRSGFVSGKQFWRKQRQVVTSRCHSSNISGFQHTMVLQKREKLTCMTFLCVIAHQEQNETHTSLPSFDNSRGRLCQKIVEIQKSCYLGYVTSHFSLLSKEERVGEERVEDDYRTGCRNVMSLSTTTFLFRTTFTRTIKLNLLLKWLLGTNLSQSWNC